MAILDLITIGSQQIIITDSNPTITGVDAPQGSLILLNDGSGFYLKTNTLSTDWTKSITEANLTGITSVGTITTGTWQATPIADAYIATAYIKADGTRALTGNWAAGAFYASHNGVRIGSAANTIDLDAAGTLTLGSTNSSIVNVGTASGSTINIGSATSTVNILGTVNYIQATNTQIKDALITLNKGGVAASAANTGFEIEENNVITGYFKTTSGRDGFQFLAPANANSLTLSFTALTGNRVLTIPNVTGTIITSGDTATVTNTMLAGGIDLTTKVTGILPVANGGTGVSTFGGVNTILYTTAANTLASIATANNGVLVTNGTGVPSIGTTLPTAVQSNITTFGTITSGTLSNGVTATFKDTLFTLQDDADITKQLIFSLGGISTATTRTITIPDYSGSIVLRDNTSRSTVTTTNTTATTIQTVATVAGESYLVEVRFISKKTAGTGAGVVGDSNTYIRTFKAKNVGGTLTLSSIQSDYTLEDINAHNVSVTTSGTNILLQVIGSLNNTVNWVSYTDISKL